MGFVGNLLGIKKPTPQVAAAPAVQKVEETAESMKKEKKDTAASRARLFATEGGILGEELGEGQVKKRSTLFGN